MMTEKEFKACIYTRLSQEDNDRTESNSITTQKTMIRDFISEHPEIEAVSEKVDDGYSGTSFDRPGFKEMMKEIRDGKVNCIIVKDLSRFGRNYIEVGNFLDKVFPFLDVRFIAINDGYDSIDKDFSDSLTVPFKNLVNEAYCTDISQKIRAYMALKRERGEYFSACVIYGYARDPKNPSHLVPDPYAAEVVRNIFNWRQSGVSIHRIADKLNKGGVPCPMEYRLSQKEYVPTTFRSKRKAKWYYTSVRRILENEMYLGTMVQGKSTTPNHRVKKRILTKKEDWVRVEGTHEPIIEADVFWDVQELIKRDFRTAPGKETVYPFAGYLVCADCRGNMYRKTIYSRGKPTLYYMCSTRIKKIGCTWHAIKENVMNKAVLEAIRGRAEAASDMYNRIRATRYTQTKVKETRTFDKQIADLTKNLEQRLKYKDQLYDNLQAGTISMGDYDVLRRKYEEQIDKIREDIMCVEEQKEDLLKGRIKEYRWMQKWMNYQEIQEIERIAVVELIDQIEIGEGERIEIHFRYSDEFESARRILGLTKEDEANGQEEQKWID